jgi:hypothetical protein
VIVVNESQQGSVHMQIKTIGLDIAKNVFQVHGIDAAEKVVVRKQLRRSQMLAFFKLLPPCLIGMEACATSHYWARELAKLGHQVRLMPAKDVKAYIERNKLAATRPESGVKPTCRTARSTAHLQRHVIIWSCGAQFSPRSGGNHANGVSPAGSRLSAARCGIRDVLALFGGLPVAWPLGAAAQQSERGPQSGGTADISAGQIISDRRLMGAAAFIVPLDDSHGGKTLTPVTTIQHEGSFVKIDAFGDPRCARYKDGVMCPNQIALRGARRRFKNWKWPHSDRGSLRAAQA